MSDTAYFQVAPRLAILLGETYRSSEQAVKELVDNAWDADAEEVWIELPSPMTDAPVRVTDSGTGMTEEEVRQEYLRIARDRRTRGEFTAGKKRRVKGKRGIGKFAGLMIADLMTIETRTRGRLTTLSIPRQALVEAAEADLERVQLAMHTGPDSTKQGTLITLTTLNQNLSFPDPQRLKELLVLEYGREPGFSIYVNGHRVTMQDMPGEYFAREGTLATLGPVRLSFKITDQKQLARESGIAVRVAGKIVGRPTNFRLEEDDEIPKGVLRRVYGEVEADGLLNDVTADWGAVIENSKGYLELEEFVRPVLKSELRRTFKREFALQHGRIKQEIDRRLSRLPEHRRAYAKKIIEKVIIQLYREKQERIQPIVSVLLEALERDEYWQVLRAIDEAKHSDVEVFAETLAQFGLIEIALIGKQAQSRLRFLNYLDELWQNPQTLEKQMHMALKDNLWVLGREFALISSNQTLKSVIESYTTQKFRGDQERKRPDLLLLSRPDRRHTLIEFKRPDHTISRTDQTQAEGYRDELISQFEAIDIVLVGKACEEPLLRDKPTYVRFLSYAGIISSARSELDWLLKSLTDPRAKSADLS
jgi:hypothetical protein